MNTEICLFFIISGLLLASLLRKPTIEGQSSMDEFKKMDKNTVCFEGTNIEDKAECERAIKALNLKGGETVTVNDGNVPAGCSWRENPGRTSIQQWNTSKTGNPNESLEPICYSKKAKQSGARFMLDARN